MPGLPTYLVQELHAGTVACLWVATSGHQGGSCVVIIVWVVVYYAPAAHVSSAGITCWHCSMSMGSYQWASGGFLRGNHCTGSRVLCPGCPRI